MYKMIEELGFPHLLGNINPCGGVEGDDKDTPC